MRIAISATGPSLDAEVDPRFGRCQYFIAVTEALVQELPVVEYSQNRVSREIERLW